MNWTWLGLITVVFLIFSCFTGFRRGFIKEAVSTFLVILSLGIVWMINPYVNTFIRENTSVYQKIEEGFGELVNEKVIGAESEKEEQVLDSMGIPGIVADGILENNSSETYRYLAVQTFEEYVSEYLATMAVNGLSFLLSFFLATVSIHMITYALNLLARLPVINGINKLAGAALGGIKAVAFIWIAMLILTVLCETPVGKAGLDMIEKDSILHSLYEWNILAQMFTGIFYGS